MFLTKEMEKEKFLKIVKGILVKLSEVFCGSNFLEFWGECMTMSCKVVLKLCDVTIKMFFFCPNGIIFFCDMTFVFSV